MIESGTLNDFVKRIIFPNDLHGRKFGPENKLQNLQSADHIVKYIFDSDVFDIYLQNLYLKSPSAADRNVTVQWQGRFGCLSVYCC
jgi:hypothetical protein